MSKERKVLFFDDFNGDSVDLTKWTIEEHKGPMNGGKRYTTRPENIRVKDGCLEITALRENLDGCDYTSGAVNSSEKFSFCYGRMEMRAKLPYGEGMWPAFWTLGDAYNELGDEKGWPYGGEIDVMEFVGVGGEEERNNTEGVFNYGCEVYTDGKMGNNRSTSNLHWGADREHHYSVGGMHCLPEGIFNDDFHIFGMEWTKEKIAFFVDDTVCCEVDINQPGMLDTFHKPHWMIVNLAIVQGWGPELKDITPLPQTYYVDWVRVLAPEEEN